MNNFLFSNYSSHLGSFKCAIIVPLRFQVSWRVKIKKKKTEHNISVLSRFIVRMTSLKGDVISVRAWVTHKGNSGKKILFSSTLTKEKSALLLLGYFCLSQGISTHTQYFTLLSWDLVETLRLFLFSSQLLVEFGDVVVPLCLVAGPGYGGLQLVFLPEILDLELPAAISGAVGEDGLAAG